MVRKMIVREYLMVAKRCAQAKRVEALQCLANQEGAVVEKHTHTHRIYVNVDEDSLRSRRSLVRTTTQFEQVCAYVCLRLSLP